MTAHRQESDDGDEIIQPPVEPWAAARRDGEEAGVFYDDAYKPGEVGAEAGIIAGNRDDPVLVCGIGYPLLSDLAFGTVVAYHIAQLDIPGVAVADASHTPVATFQTLTEGDYHTTIVVGAEKRGDGVFNDGTPSRKPGTIHEFGPGEYEVQSDEELVKRVGEGAMGSNTVKNVLVISEAFGGLPEATHAITVEVGYDSWGMNVDEFTEPVEKVFEDVFDRVIGHINDVLGLNVQASLSDPRDCDLNDEILDPVGGEPPGDPESSGNPLENELVNAEAIARLDEDAREKINHLDEGIVAAADR